MIDTFDTIETTMYSFYLECDILGFDLMVLSNLE